MLYEVITFSLVAGEVEGVSFSTDNLVSHLDFDQRQGTFKSISGGSNVITSYSIHYTKLYDMLKTLSRIILGALYLFSGFVKAVDPVGGAIKISEYLEIVGLHNLGYIAVIFAILLSTIEFILGFQLFFAFKTKKATLPTMLFMAFFTILTLYSAIYSYNFV